MRYAGASGGTMYTVLAIAGMTPAAISAMRGAKGKRVLFMPSTVVGLTLLATTPGFGFMTHLAAAAALDQ